MLEKNKDYIEMLVSSTDCTFIPDEANISIEGYSYGSYWRLPDPGEDYILISKEKFDRLQANVGINEELAKQWEINYNLLLKKIGFDTVEELVDYLYSEVKCDTLHEAISKLHDEVEWIGDELASANSENNSWKATAECNTPKELREKLNLLRGNIEEWKEATGYPNPSSAKTAIESGASWCHAYNETKAANKKLVDDVESWRNVTGYSTPEGFLSAMLNDPDNTDTVLWKNATGCNSPGIAKCRIDALINEATDWEDKYNHLLELTGYKSEEAIHAILVLSDEKHQYQNMRDYINSLKRHSKFSEANWQNATGFKTPEDAKDYLVAKLSESGESNESLARKVLSWQNVTGFSTPENCSSYIDTLEKKLEDIKDLIEED